VRSHGNWIHDARCSLLAPRFSLALDTRHSTLDLSDPAFGTGIPKMRWRSGIFELWQLVVWRPVRVTRWAAWCLVNFGAVRTPRNFIFEDNIRGSRDSRELWHFERAFGVGRKP
jgi:hypothetical protein